MLVIAEGWGTPAVPRGREARSGTGSSPERKQILKVWREGRNLQ